MNARTRLATMASLMGMALLILPALAAPVGAAPLTTSSNPPQQWAYGARFWDNQSGVGTFGQYNSSAFFGWDVVVTLTNTSATTAEIHGVRTVALHYYAQFCRPNCTSASATAKLSVRAWQQDSAFVNLSSTATDYVRGANNSSVATAALGLSNASATSRANLTETYTILRGTSTGASGRLDVARSTDLSVAFSPSLGLVPWNLSKGETWNSSSAFTASGGWNDSYSFLNTLRGSSTSSSGRSTGSVSHSGQVALRGADRGNYTLKNGRNVTVIVVAVSGPFELRDGLFLAPAGSDLFGGATATWAVKEYGEPLMATSALDVSVDAIHHTAVVAAASSSFQAQATPLGTSTVQSGTGTAVAGAPPSAGETLQAQPETVPVAEANARCYVSGCAGGSATGSMAPGALLLVAAAAIVVVLVGVFAVLRMRPKPPVVHQLSPPTGGMGPQS